MIQEFKGCEIYKNILGWHQEKDMRWIIWLQFLWSFSIINVCPCCIQLEPSTALICVHPGIQKERGHVCFWSDRELKCWFVFSMWQTGRQFLAWYPVSITWQYNVKMATVLVPTIEHIEINCSLIFGRW
jgi:hypothetical protein